MPAIDRDKTIHKYAEEHDVDRIVMGSNCRSGASQRRSSAVRRSGMVVR